MLISERSRRPKLALGVVPQVGKMFRKDKNKKLCEEILKEVAERHKIEIVELSVMPDRIHLIVSFRSNEPIKGLSTFKRSIILRTA